MAQDYANRSLVIVSDGDDDIEWLRDYVDEVGDRNNVQLLAVPQRSRPLGALRNLSVQEAKADYVCQWDDDDLFHPRRLSEQMSALRRNGGDACFLSDQLQFVTSTCSLYWCDWARPRNRPQWAPVIPNTLLCDIRAMPRYPETGPNATRSEDMCVMLEILHTTRTVRLSGKGNLYVYVTHGDNTWDEAHHLGIPYVCGLSTADLRARRSQVAEAGAAYRFHGPITVRNWADEGVFVISRDGRMSDCHVKPNAR